MTEWAPIFDKYGWPGLIVIGIVVLARWLKPWAERVFLAHIDRQARAAKALEDMATQSIALSKEGIAQSGQVLEIQRKVVGLIETLPQTLERLLRAKPPHEHR